MDLVHAHKTAHRFHMSATVLGSCVMETRPEIVFRDKMSLPIIVRHDGIIYCLSDVQKSGRYDLPTDSSDFISPYVVNGAFSLELHLKLLVFCEKKTWPNKEHKLENLFELISVKSRKNIDDKIGEELSRSKYIQQSINLLKQHGVEIEWNAQSLIKRSSQAFINWRYAFESTAGCFAAYSELQKALKICLSEYE